MRYAYTAESTYAAEKPALDAGVDLMARAVAHVVDVVMAYAPQGSSVGVFAGGGNNGADALYAAAALARQGYPVRVALAFDPGAATDATAQALASVREAGIKISGPGEELAAVEADVWIDGVTGIGMTPPAKDNLAALLTELSRERTARRPMVIAVDLPSGLGADSGAVDGPVLEADHTVTFGRARAAHFLPPAAYECGQLHVRDIGIDEDFAAQTPAVHRVEVDDLAGAWPMPGPRDHKYTRGVVGMVTGSAQYPGAAVLSVGGALACGPGMVRYLGGAGADVLRRHPEVVTQHGRAQAWVVGSGIAGHTSPVALMVERTIVAAMAHEVPLVVDAGALDWVAGSEIAGVPMTQKVVLTPHAGELTSVLVRAGEEVTREQIEADPATWARKAAKITGATVVLKGGITLIASGRELYSQADATPWMASAGTGDVLAGILGTILAGLQANIEQNREPAWTSIQQAVAGGVALHGLAGTHASGGAPISASEIPGGVSHVLRSLLAH